jgi:WXG100 family type VII secretion target
MADKFRGHYAQLKEIAKTFGDQGNEVQSMIQNLKSKQQQLEGGDWKGDSATKFFQEMNGPVYTALNKLQKAMGEANSITTKIAKITKDTEDTSSKIFIFVIKV